MVLKKKRGRGKKSKSGGDADPLGADGALGDGSDGEGGDGADGEGEANRHAMEEHSLDFDHELYKFAGNREIVSRYVALLSSFHSVPKEATHCALKLISRLVRQCNLEALLFQLSVMQTISTILDGEITPALFPRVSPVPVAAWPRFPWPCEPCPCGRLAPLPVAVCPLIPCLRGRLPSPLCRLSTFLPFYRSTTAAALCHLMLTVHPFGSRPLRPDRQAAAACRLVRHVPFHHPPLLHRRRAQPRPLR